MRKDHQKKGETTGRKTTTKRMHFVTEAYLSTFVDPEQSKQDAYGYLIRLRRVFDSSHSKIRRLSDDSTSLIFLMEPKIPHWKPFLAALNRILFQSSSDGVRRGQNRKLRKSLMLLHSLLAYLFEFLGPSR